MAFDPAVGWVVDVETKSASFDYSFELSVGDKAAVLPTDETTYRFTSAPPPVVVDLGDVDALPVAIAGSTVEFGWGPADGQLGRSPDPAGVAGAEQHGPGGLAQLPDGAAVVLDNWNARPVRVVDDQVTMLPLEGFQPSYVSGFAIDGDGHVAVSDGPRLRVFAQRAASVDLVGDVSVEGMRPLDLPLIRLEIDGDAIVNTDFDGVRRAIATVDGRLIEGLPAVESPTDGPDPVLAVIAAEGVTLLLPNYVSVELSMAQDATTIHVAFTRANGTGVVVMSTDDGSLLLIAVAPGGAVSAARIPDVGRDTTLAEPTRFGWDATTGMVSILESTSDGCVLRTFLTQPTP